MFQHMVLSDEEITRGIKNNPFFYFLIDFIIHYDQNK